MSNKIARMYVAPEFKRMIKKQAIEEDIDTIGLTRKIALENNENVFNDKKKNVKFNFKF